MPSTFYYVSRNGVIGKARSVPKSALPLFSSTRERTKRVNARARLCRHDNETMLVPGVPEAQGTPAALEAIEAFIRWIVHDQPPGKREWEVSL